MGGDPGPVDPPGQPPSANPRITAFAFFAPNTWATSFASPSPAAPMALTRNQQAL